MQSQPSYGNDFTAAFSTPRMTREWTG